MLPVNRTPVNPTAQEPHAHVNPKNMLSSAACSLNTDFRLQLCLHHTTAGDIYPTEKAHVLVERPFHSAVTVSVLQ